MEVRLAEVVAGLPLVDHDIEPWLGWVANQHRIGVAAIRIVLPRNLLGQLINDGGRIELDGGSRCDQAYDECGNDCAVRHDDLPSVILALGRERPMPPV